jgi:hypothetical protein
MQYKHNTKPLDQIGRELGIQYTLEGCVRRDSDKRRITAQLIQLKDQTHLWTRQYDREPSNLLTLQGEIAQEIAEEIQLKIGGHERIRLTKQAALSPKAAEAYKLYRKGRYFWNKRTRQGLQQAIEYSQQAIDKDPASARDYAGLAEAYALWAASGLAPTEFMPKACAAAQRARRAIQLNPNYAPAHHWYGECPGFAGAFRQGISPDRECSAT